MAVGNGDTVLVHYKGSLLDGSVFDSSEGREPLKFTLGSGEVIPGFDEAVTGLEVGDTATVSIAPENAYGPRIPELAHTVSKEDFGNEPYLGGMVTIVSPQGDELPGIITAIEGDEVSIDFNHPLAGETLVFDIELVGAE